MSAHLNFPQFEKYYYYYLNSNFKFRPPITIEGKPAPLSFFRTSSHLLQVPLQIYRKNNKNEKEKKSISLIRAIVLGPQPGVSLLLSPVFPVANPSIVAIEKKLLPSRQKGIIFVGWFHCWCLLSGKQFCGSTEF